MDNEIISYVEMCRREATSLQRGMNFNLGKCYSVILMSVRKNAPYRDRFEEEGTTLIYEGHDMPRSEAVPQPKLLDQPGESPSGVLTQNGKFFEAAHEYTSGSVPPHLVKVYEKIHQGVWAFNGIFHLVDAWTESDGNRQVYKFKLLATDDEVSEGELKVPEDRRRIIPTPVKIQVWDRDKGRCVVCGAMDELHFDHIVPYSKGGSSLTAENVQLLCARHNLSKGAKIL